MAARIIPSPSLLEVLTEQIIIGRLSVLEARQIVIRYSYFKKAPIRKVPETVRDIEKLEKEMMIRAIERCSWNASLAADQMGMSRTKFYRKVKYFGFEKKFWIDE